MTCLVFKHVTGYTGSHRNCHALLIYVYCMLIHPERFYLVVLKNSTNATFLALYRIQCVT